jgi:CelD/BcsL family acetyltransferase involved in cellulose biosynthesis
MSTSVLELTHPTWKAFVEARHEATPFHYPAWGLTLAECYAFRAFAIAAHDNDGRVVGGIPVIETRVLRSRRWIALPYSDSCGPLGDARLVAAGLDDLRREAGVPSAEIRSSVPGAGGTHVVRGVIHILQLDPDPEVVRRTFDSSTRRNITRSQRDGVVVRVGTTRTDLLDTFYKLHLATRRRQGVPIQPRRFFELLWDRVLASGLGFVLVAEQAQRPVAAAVFLAWNGRLVYKFGASDPSARACRPNHAIFWHVIERGCRDGYLTLDFGRSDTGNVGLRRFKSGWGALEEELRYLSYGAVSQGGGRAPAVVSTIIQSSPEWVCQRIGEWFYRYAA